MIRIDNHSGLPHLLYEKTGPSGEPFDVIVLRGTFDFARDGEPMALSAIQRPIQFGDRYDGPINTQPLKAVLAEEGDLVLGKLGTDVLMHGHVRSYQGQPLRHWLAELTVGSVGKVVRVSGPREIRDSLTGWCLDEATPVDQVPLDYRLAFGGCFYDPQPPAESMQASSLHYPMNPAGCGWLPDASSLRSLEQAARQRIEGRISSIRRMPAPQLDDPRTPYEHPFQQLIPQGFGAIARWWEPRTSLQGTYDQHWEEERYPFFPKDFDPRFYNSAPGELVSTSYLTGNEHVQLKGCLASGHRAMRLPGVVPLVLINERSPNNHIQYPLLDTVRIDLDSYQATLLWRLPLARQMPINQLTIGLVALPAEKQTGKRISQG
ncbi:DUF2169 domain-containing protein [Pseudomonas sp. PDNC002]|uniref:DUF2169 family type VI secretion system accessory protein n=1 Tax=Pseudomonas sp. PDNC002 TaxID=2811422 RepID=UPI0019640A03|nr:DUF2169 domain-containing protein [Pseudomonas sp. PDNC002]QRY77896.1 DUF2169 domain-containing protein [Pseudomonas sp. PDNC002]